jgi:single-strand DNA-binding protein
VANGNNISIIGNLTRDPELRFTTSGRAVAQLGVAVNDRYQVNFFDVTAWAQLGENVAASLVKGDRVAIQGRLVFRQWEDQEGAKRSKVEVTADSVAPDMRFATVQIEKNERTSSGGGDATPAEVYNEEPF